MRLAVAEPIIRALADSRAVDDIREMLARGARELGFDHFALNLDFAHGPEEGTSLLFHDYPSAWAETYVAFDLGKTDPIRRAGDQRMHGFPWSNVSDIIPLTSSEVRTFRTGQHHGLVDGYTIPRHLPGQASGTCTFALGPDGRLPVAMLDVAELVGAAALAATWRLARHGFVPRWRRPTDRQRDCILWAARGKTDWEISRILGISHGTVIQHLKEARERYNTRKRASLVVCALFDGLISFSVSGVLRPRRSRA